MFQKFQHQLVLLPRHLLRYLLYHIMTTVADITGDASAEVLNITDDEFAVERKIQSNGKPTFTDTMHCE